LADQFNNFNELKNHYRAGTDYHIQTIWQSGLLVILGIHAGGIEMGSSELAKAIAGNEYSLYLFEGFTETSQKLHITSTNFDEPSCIDMVRKHRTSLSLHGFADKGTDPKIFLGGKNLILAHQLLDVLNENGYSTKINTGKFAATDHVNICNRTSSGTGVQIELSARLRSIFFEDYCHRAGRKNKTPQFDHFVNVMREGLADYLLREIQ
jgi:phage replication-related protein YjqB (UPF0714/DUF867 family)